MRKPDYFLIITVVVLILLGLIILASVLAAISQEKFGSPTFYFFRHLVFGLIPGVLLGFAAFKIPLSYLKKWAPILLLGNLFLLVLVFVPKIGISLGGARSWLNLGITSFQPSEVLKLTFILYLASWLAARTDKAKKNFATTLIAFFVITGIISLLLILQSDVGTLGIIVITGLLMYFLAGTPCKHIPIIISAVIAVLALSIKIAPYRFNRFLVFINPNIDPMGLSYQIKQALIAIGSGGILGSGLGITAQRFSFLPQPMSDSIFAIFSKETGFAGSLFLLFLFLVFAWRGFTIAKMTQDKFYRLTALGISSWIVCQAFVNIGALVGILPLTGIPLPFISYGGSALIAELIGAGILLNISKKTAT